MTNSIFSKIKLETKIAGWITKTSSEKNISIAIYDILTENDNNNNSNRIYPEKKVDELIVRIINLAKHHL
jgi:hypothetical protein